LHELASTTPRWLGCDGGLSAGRPAGILTPWHLGRRPWSATPRRPPSRRPWP